MTMWKTTQKWLFLEILQVKNNNAEQRSGGRNLKRFDFHRTTSCISSIHLKPHASPRLRMASELWNVAPLYRFMMSSKMYLPVKRETWRNIINFSKFIVYFQSNCKTWELPALKLKYFDLVRVTKNCTIGSCVVVILFCFLKSHSRKLEQ